MEKTVSAVEAAEQLGISYHGLLEMVEAKRLPAVRVPSKTGKVRISQRAIEEFLLGKTWSYSRGTWVPNRQILAWEKRGG